MLLFLLACVRESPPCGAGTHEEGGACVADAAGTEAADSGDTDGDSGGTQGDTDTGSGDTADTGGGGEVTPSSVVLAWPTEESGCTIDVLSLVLVADDGDRIDLYMDADHRAMGAVLEVGRRYTIDYDVVRGGTCAGSSAVNDAIHTVAAGEYLQFNPSASATTFSWLVSGVDHDPHEVYVVFDDGVDPTYAASRIADAGATEVAQVYTDPLTWIVTSDGGATDLALVLIGEPNVRAAWPHPL